MSVNNRSIDAASVIQNQRFNWQVALMLLLSFLVMSLDGYEIQALAFAAPSIIRDWGIDRSSFGPIFGAGLFGVMLGGLVFGYLGDRIGRRPSMIACTLIFGVFTLMTGWARDPNDLMVLRFLAGIGVGGLTPLCFALIVEYAPERLRGLLIAIIMLGYIGGGSTGGIVSVLLVPDYGWRIVFWIGGIVPFAAALLLYLWLPESIKYLVLRGNRSAEVAKILNRIDVNLNAPPTSTFFLSDQLEATGIDTNSGPIAKVRGLFDRELNIVTPLFWIAYIGSSMTMFFITSWMAVLAEATGHSPEQAAIGLTILNIGGAIGGLIVGWLVDRFGLIAVTVVPLLASPLVASLGQGHLSEGMFALLTFLVGFVVMGAHQGLNSSVGLFYPSANRSYAVGWALSVAKVGSILGPMIGGFLLAKKMSISSILLYVAIPPLVVATCIFGLGLIQRRRALIVSRRNSHAIAD